MTVVRAFAPLADVHSPLSQSAGGEPIAITGIGCRLPGGANDAPTFWRLLLDGRTGIREVPADRWSLARYHHPDPAAPGAMVTRWGGFVDHLKEFDARFWGIAPREAARMDPQQRWLLEVAWEAIEDGGTAPSRWRGKPVGVFVGVSSNDYASLQLRYAREVDAYTNSGNTASIAANRISYLLDLRGPSVSVDTACSSALVAVWMACENIWSGRCSAALAGGVNALIAPQSTIGFSKASMMSPTGRCFAFDARANGYVRAEGAGIVVLKPLAAAIADGDRIYATIRGAAVNQDGHTSSMTVPGMDAQAEMLRTAYRSAGIAPARVSYVEAHGTGTPVGDPIETAALGRVLREGRAADTPCLIGSVKTNIGHLESGAGIAGLIKGALVLHHRTIPASLNFERPNPQIPMSELRLAVADRTLPLVAHAPGEPVVGVNSFGFGGTNAHVVLEAVPRDTPAAQTAPERNGRPLLLPISARDETALREYVRRYRALLAREPSSLVDICVAAGERKEHHELRVVITGGCVQELRAHAHAWLDDPKSTSHVVAGRAAGSAPPVFVFTGQGVQWWAMGRRLLEREPVARDAVERIDRIFRPLAGWSIADELARDETQSNIDRTDVAQPAIFALQVAVAALWKEWGIEPAAVLGHSVGEVAAAHCAGVYSLEDATTIVFHRSRLQHTTRGQGRMLAVGISHSEARQLMQAEGGRVELAAVNSPRQATLCGDAEALGRIESRLKHANTFARWLRIDYAFHSAHMDPIRDELIHALRDIRPRLARTPLISTVTGCSIAGESLDAAYWWRNVREPVLFAPAVLQSINDGHRTFLEIGAHPALESSVTECLAEAGQHGAVFHSLRRDRDDTQEMTTSLAGMHVAGIPIDWRKVNGGSGVFVLLPAYPWTLETFWAESPRAAAMRLADPVHPLLGLHVDAPVPTWRGQIDLARLAYLKDHCLWNGVVFPAAGFAEMGLAVGRALFPDEPHSIEALEIKAALFIAEGTAPTLQTVLDPESRQFTIHGMRAAGEAWEVHATGTLRRTPARDPVRVDVAAVRERLGDPLPRDHYVAACSARGYQFGPSFQQVQALWRAGDEALVEIHVPPSIGGGIDRYCVHPAVLDACFHVFIGLALQPAAARAAHHLFLPRSVARVELTGQFPASRLWALGRLTTADDDCLVADIEVHDDDGQRVAIVRGLRLERFAVDHADDLDDQFYRWHWEPRHLFGSGAGTPPTLATIDDIVRAAERALPEIAQRHDVTEYHRDFLPRLKATTDVLVRAAVTRRGWRPAAGARFTFDEFVVHLDILDGYLPMARLLLRSLERRGWLRTLGDGAWEVTRDLGAPDAAQAIDELEQAHPMAMPEVAVLRATGPRLRDILAGELDAVEVLFPNGTQAALERFYAEGSAYPAHFAIMAATLRAAIDALPPGRTIRILEVGGGTGALKRAILPALPADRVEYWFTDVGATFVASARKDSGDASFVQFRTFDLDREPGAQGIPTRYFDVVIAADVLHATRDLRQTLGHLRAALAPGGLLMALEIVTSDFARDTVVFGLLKGWWSAIDRNLRSDGPLVGIPTWMQVLTDSGFVDAAALTTVGPGEAEHAVLVALAPTAPADGPATTAVSSSPSRYVLLADEQGVAHSLGALLEQRGHAVTIVAGDLAGKGNGHADGVTAAGGEDALRRILEGAVSPGKLAGVIHCRALDHARAADLDAQALGRAQHTGLLSAFHLIRAVAGQSTRVWFVTRNVQAVVDGDPVDGIAAAPMIGLARVANNEHECRFAIVDLDSCSPDDAARSLCDEVTLPADNELEVAYRGGRRHALRLRSLRLDDVPKRRYEARRPDGSVTPFRLQIDKPGILKDLALHETSRRPPAAGELEVRVRAAGINFRDLMKALGNHPGRPIDLLWLGDDFSGVVERVGADVTAFAPGDEVVGMAPWAFRAYATTDARLVFRKPPAMSFADAATLPTVFLTAHYALVHLARVQAGERILIHAAAGGVGQAAMQIATALSLEIFATAGTPAKRAMLSETGAHHVMSSRTLEFADEIRSITAGGGVDVVLNSLAGDFIPKSIAALAPFGRFLEIGKVDIYRNTRVGLEPFRNNISYFVIDLSQHVRERPAMIAHLFAELGERFADGRYRPVPMTAFPVTEAAEAFRFMAHGRHVGKNVLTFDAGRLPIAFDSDDTHRFRDTGTYLITGGAGGFGLEVGKWLAAHGARHLVLMSRSGPRDERAMRDIDALRAGGVRVLDARGDVTKGGDVERTLQQVRAGMPPLVGVFHAAMVIDDDFIVALDESRIRQVLEPKMSGAWNLHLATRDHALEHFVCFSSFSTVIALPKQGSYNAGNAFLDALAHHRRALGLPALTVNLGALLGAGYVERHKATGEALARMGFEAFRVDEALRVLERLLFIDAPQVVASRVNWDAVLKLSPLVATSNTYAGVARRQQQGGRQGSLEARLRTASVDERTAVLERFVAEQVAAVCGLATPDIDRATPLASLGVDSLMSLELTMRLERELGLRIPMSDVLSTPTIAGLAEVALRLLQPKLVDGAPAHPTGEGSTGANGAALPPLAQGVGNRDGNGNGVAPTRHVVLIRAGARAPLFVFHPVGGGVGIYAGLAASLPSGIPIYGIESSLVADPADEYADLDSMVAGYAAAVRSVHPGPYRLFGFSLGGYLAARVAAVLEHDGECVDLVGIMDWDARQKTSLAAQREALTKLTVASYRFVQEQTGILRELPEDELREELSGLVQRVTSESEGGGDVFFQWLVERRLATSREGEIAAAQHLRRIERHCRLLTPGLPLAPLSAPLFIWRASRGFGSDLASWGHQGPHGREFVIDGDHHALVRPATLSAVARQLADALQHADHGGRRDDRPHDQAMVP